MSASDDVSKRVRAARRFQTIALIVVVALIASAYLGPRYSLFGFAFPVAVTAVVIFYFYHRTQQNTDQPIVMLGALLILVTWYGTLADAHDRGQHRDIERLGCDGVRGENAEHRCAEIRNILATPLFPGSDD